MLMQSARVEKKLRSGIFGMWILVMGQRKVKQIVDREIRKNS